MSTVGGILSVVGGVQYRGGYHDKCGGILSTMGVFSTVGGHDDARGRDTMMHVGVFRCSVPWGENLLLFEYPMVLNTPTVLMISPHMYHDIPHGTQISKDGIPPWY